GRRGLAAATASAGGAAGFSRPGSPRPVVRMSAARLPVVWLGAVQQPASRQPAVRPGAVERAASVLAVTRLAVIRLSAVALAAAVTPVASPAGWSLGRRGLDVGLGRAVGGEDVGVGGGGRSGGWPSWPRPPPGLRCRRRCRGSERACGAARGCRYRGRR